MFLTLEDQKENVTNQTTQSEPPEIDYNLTEWLHQQLPDQYTLQLISLVKREDILKFISQENFNEQIGYIEVTINGITRYAAIYGLYDSYENAKTALSGLPPGLKTKPWIRKIGVVKKVLKKCSPLDSRVGRGVKLVKICQKWSTWFMDYPLTSK